MNAKETLYKKMERYVKIKTPSNENNAGQTPSSKEQFVLAKLLVKELKELGVKNVIMTKHAYVIGELPSNGSKKNPVIGFIGHMDTVSAFTNGTIKPKLHKNYKGGKILIDAKKQIYIDPAKDPYLYLAKGHDIVSSDGSTILGADDKAGIAIIMTMLEYLKNNPQIKHGTIKVAFTPDEEIAHGSALMPLDKFNPDFAFTIDGGFGGATNGNFNGDSVFVNITGVSTHTGYAKGILVNPITIAAELISLWPKKHRPEHTEKEKGFIHFNEINGSIEKVTLKAIAREHDLKKLFALEKELKTLCQKLEKLHKGAKIEVVVKESYRNMKDVLAKRPEAMNRLLKAFKEEKISYRLAQARGGTDGARLSFMGIPTPDFSAGYSGEHGPFEWVSLNAMEDALRVALNIVKEI